ncbi:MAG: hypothetical protein ACI32C_05865 [Candidatus Enteromonas sp.]
MKQKITLLVVSLLGLTSCWFRVNHRRNIILPGRFSGVGGPDESVLCDLLIEPIAEEEYEKAKGINVTRDEINGSHYSMRFSIARPGEDPETVDFANFKDAYDGARGTPISYVDDNRWWFSPLTWGKDETLSTTTATYSIENYKEKFEVYAFLYPKEE